ncbi:MAG: TetR/AcrR family transcriptional regulator [Phycisphaerales bacterium]
MTRLPAAKRREQLLDTAVLLFAERGFGGATTAELARAAGVTEPIIYRHFRSKRDLFIAVIDRTGDLTIRQWDQHLKSAKDPAQRLKRLIGANPMATDRGRGIYRVIVQAMMEIKDEEILKALQRHVKAIHEFVTAEVVKAQKQGQVSKAFTPEITAWTLLHLGLGYGILGPLGIEGHAIDPTGVRVRHVIEQLMLGDRARQVQNEMLKKHGDGDEPTDG